MRKIQLKEEIKTATQTAKDLYPTFNNDPTRIAVIISKPTTTKEITSTEQKENNKHWGNVLMHLFWGMLN